MIGDFRSGGESFLTRALKNHKITFGKSAFQYPASSACIIEMSRMLSGGRLSVIHAVAIFEPQLNRFVADGHYCRGARTGNTTCPEISDAAFSKNARIPSLQSPRGNNESVPGLHYREPGEFLFPDLQKALSSPRGWPVTDP